MTDVDLLKVIATDLGLTVGISESDDSFRDRVILSALSKWMLTACFDDAGKASAEHVKHAAAERLDLFRHAFGMPPAQGANACRSADVVEYIYQNLLDNGAFYHKAYHVLPVERTPILFGEASVIRGMVPEERCQFSGLAPIINESANEVRIEEAFDLPAYAARDIIDLVWSKSNPVSDATVISEYLKFDDLRRGYYAPLRKDAYPVTMGRTPHPNVGHEHYIIRQNSVRRIPDVLIEEGLHEYCRLAIVNNAVQQTVSVLKDGSVLKLNFGYKPPSADLRLLRYVAWPSSLSALDSAFAFSIHPGVWPALQQRLTDLNYKVVQS